MGQQRHKTSEPGHTEFGTFIRRVSLVLLLTTTIVALLFVKWTRPQAAPKATPRVASTASSGASALDAGDAALEPHRIFPYSVIPGGVRSKAELVNALLNDPVAAAHYAGFDVSNAHVVDLDRGRSVYLSYRKGDHIYWMSRKLWLPAGEVVLTDGVHEARTRCGNRISDVPQFPVARVEPSRAALDTPLAPEIAGTDALTLPFSTVQPTPPFGEFGGTDPVGGQTFFPPFVPIVGGPGTPGGGTPGGDTPGGGTPGGGTPSGPTPGGPPGAPPVSTPEPASLLLLSTGLLGVWVSRRKARR
jgi:PEP-CTERM motif